MVDTINNNILVLDGNNCESFINNNLWIIHNLFLINNNLNPISYTEKSHIPKNNYKLFILFNNNNTTDVIGYSIIIYHLNLFEICDIMISPTYRNKGNGSYLFEAILRYIMMFINNQSHNSIINNIKYRIYLNTSFSNPSFRTINNIAIRYGFKIHYSKKTIFGNDLSIYSRGLLTYVKYRNNNLILSNDESSNKNISTSMSLD
jgi:GNAT superfamily N-acetyltransferase